QRDQGRDEQGDRRVQRSVQGHRQGVAPGLAAQSRPAAKAAAATPRAREYRWAKEMPRPELAAAKAAHPNVRVDDALFARWVDERAKGSTLAELHLADLYLACALAHSDPAALTELEKKLLPKTVPAIQRIRANAQFVDDALQ